MGYSNIQKLEIKSLDPIKRRLISYKHNQITNSNSLHIENFFTYIRITITLDATKNDLIQANNIMISGNRIPLEKTTHNKISQKLIYIENSCMWKLRTMVSKANWMSLNIKQTKKTSIRFDNNNMIHRGLQKKKNWIYSEEASF